MHSLGRRWWFGVVGASVMFLGAWAIAAPGISGRGEAAPPLSDIARQALHTRMKSHAQDMQALTMAVVLLRHDSARTLARRIADEPQISRPTGTAAGDVNAEIPDRFFVLQEKLRANAQRVADAARGSDEQRLAEAYGALSSTCVQCHAAFLARTR